MTTNLMCGIEPQNEQQRDALAKASDFLTSTDPTQRIFRMAGYAGSGKSTIAFAIAAILVAAGMRVAFTAPTHKAVNVLRKIAANQGLTGIEFFTIHAFLGLSIVKEGGEKRLRPSGINYTSMYNVVWVDECSMVGADLWRYISESFAPLDYKPNRIPPKLILMGDPAQLYPVGEGRSPTFSKEIEGITLTEVVRQKAGSPLMDFVTRARKAVTRKIEVYRAFNPQLSPETKSEGAVLSSRKAILTMACHQVEQFDTDPDRFRILSWRNKTVDYYNNHIRRHRYGANAPRFMVGERLITRDPVFAPDGRIVILQTSTECVVLSVQEATYGHYKAWKLDVEVEGSRERKQVYALHEDDQERFDDETQRLELVARKSHYLWKHYYQHLETYAQVRPCFALTVHNAQGSTFTEVAVDGADLRGRLYPQESESELKAMQEHNRLWYVAVSRARNRVLVAK